MAVPRLRTATAEDAESIRILLERAGLPTSDLTSSRPEFIVAYEDAELIGAGALQRLDRKSTRLNSSHSQISYAVFCLKKKKNRKATLYAAYTAFRPYDTCL